MPNTSDPCAAAASTSLMATMTVIIRDPRREIDGGPPCICVATISAFCPVCARRRGEPRPVPFTDGRTPYWLDVWHNDCGHPDNWESVLEEAAGQCARPDCVLLASSGEDTDGRQWFPYCSAQCAVFTLDTLQWWRVLRSYLHRAEPAMIQTPVAEGVA